ncbi:probable G-protein coupled receptor Mth-like 1 isoform X2 [Penaeus chinensis]|uniref:probable G-protein coupled receptor Mth-like 1 isoform X2 n=1 Tax=Penaeus chinensis TaxID=139456 RepID=UPI001FB6A4CD|nr:probable G-protein coupled receptor Mth-like 1 isoform X2 [Penaeus chinensis]
MPLGMGLWCAVAFAWALAASAAGEDPLPVYTEALRLPRCCAHGQALATDGSCVRHRRAAFTPQVVIEKTLVEAVNVVKEPPTAVVCAAQGGSEIVVPVVRGEMVILADPKFPAIVYWKPLGGQEPVPIKEFCVAVRAQEGTQEDQYLIKFCQQSPVALQTVCQSTYCFRKCCPEGKKISGTGCVDSSDPWQAVFSSKDDPTVTVPPHADLDVAYGMPKCGNFLVYEDFSLGPKGDLHMPGGESLPHTHYCVERIDEGEGPAKDVALVCAPEAVTCDWNGNILQPVLLSVSCVFLCVTAIIYLSVPGLRNSLNGRCLVCFVVSMFLTFLTLLVISRHRDGFGSFQCAFSALFCLTFVLATFFWLNIIYFRIWSELRSPSQDKPTTRSFLALCAYGFGGPLLVAMVGLGMDLAEADGIRPNFVLPFCWFNDYKSRWVYQYGIILALLIVNLILLVWSAILSAKRMKTWLTHRALDKIHGIPHFFWLFLIVGVAWILEIITWLVPGHCKIWMIVFDSVNALQGVFVFLASVVFRKDLKLQGWRWTRVPTDDQGPSSGRYAPSNVELEQPATRSAE